MKKAKIPLMIQDPLTAHQEGLEKVTEGYEAIQEFFFDGPVTKRVAVLDIDPDTGDLNAGVKLKLRKVQKGDIYYYADDRGKDIMDYSEEEFYQPDFIKVSTFATVLKTLELFEKERDHPEEAQQEKFGVIGRELKWAFNAPQLLIVPRAGEMANAFYNRDTHSLEFFFFPSIHHEDGRIYSALSREIVAHEAGHAIIDAIAPDLMDAYTPDSLAIHEGLADIVALLVSFDSNNLKQFILRESNGSIREENHFTNLAEEFAYGRSDEGRLRTFLNPKNLIKGSRDYVNSSEPHALCEVLTGAIYSVIIKFHESEKKRLAKTKKYKGFPKPLFSASGFALYTCYTRIKRILFRALDYLPPGEVTFADYGRAIVAADRVESGRNYLRNWFANEFVNRGIASSKELLLEDKSRGILVEWDFEKLKSSQRYIHQVVEKNKKLFLIPPGAEYEVPVCHFADYYEGKNKGRDVCIFKASWIGEESDDLGDNRLPKNRQIKMGTTLVIDVSEKRILARLSNAYPLNKDETSRIEDREKEYQGAKLLRSSFLKNLFLDGTLKLGNDALGPDGQVMQNVVRAETVNGALKIRGAAKSLHLC